MSGPRTALEWLEDFGDCLAGDHGQEWTDRANEWIEENHEATDGWRLWREYRLTVGGA